MSKGKILVIDDEEIIRNLFIDMLEGEGYEVVTVADGEEGFQEAMNNDYDLIISDIMLPGDDGLKIIKHIKNNDPDAMIIAISGAGTFEILQEALHIGVFDYVSKPFDVEKILFAVRRAISSSHLIKSNKRLLKQLKEANENLKSNLDEKKKSLEMTYEHLQDIYVRIIATLVSVIEAKDEYTKNHSENVAKYSEAIATVMNLPRAQIDLIVKAAKLHDLGKITIRDSILFKEGKLTYEEFEEIKQHPVRAEEILKHLDFLDVAIELIKQHHERFDGKGYPYGLAGEDIQLGARIICVADAYDAMTSGRHYKPEMSEAEAIQEIKNNAGTQFDPVVVEDFLKVVDSFIE